jgi:CRP/FNR family transcriptional regulator, anaerobic regulatory protein
VHAYLYFYPTKIKRPAAQRKDICPKREKMLRTNNAFLTFTRNLHEYQSGTGGITLKQFTKGQSLLRQGERAAEVLIIDQGITKCFSTEENGKDYILEFLGQGEIIGEIEVIRNTNCLCSIEAITEVRAYALSIPLFRSLFSENLIFNNLLLQEMAERIVNTASRSSAQQLYSLEHGLKKILAFQARQNLIISKEDMAAYLGITLRSLNRALKDLH